MLELQLFILYRFTLVYCRLNPEQNKLVSSKHRFEQLSQKMLLAVYTIPESTKTSEFKMEIIYLNAITNECCQYQLRFFCKNHKILLHSYSFPELILFSRIF